MQGWKRRWLDAETLGYYTTKSLSEATSQASANDVGCILVEPKYRPCVLAVFANSAGQVLICERDQPRGSWQFPQGGIEAGESPEVAIFREMGEEIGTRDFVIEAQAPGTY